MNSAIIQVLDVILVHLLWLHHAIGAVGRPGQSFECDRQFVQDLLFAWVFWVDQELTNVCDKSPTCPLDYHGCYAYAAITVKNHDRLVGQVLLKHLRIVPLLVIPLRQYEFLHR